MTDMDTWTDEKQLQDVGDFQDCRFQGKLGNQLFMILMD